jgi:16S rRNA (cytidine1402-2'-O)-methyltransferase
MTSSPGTLYVVATPIGNLEDLTFRALRVLREVDLIAAEDTRRSIKLLNHYGVHKPLVSLREHNEARESARLVKKLEDGQSIALVSDAGTPGIADPGARLVRAARESGAIVVPVPGPSAITAALSVSGLEDTEFVFMGFPPATAAAREKWFERVANEPRAVVFFEAPHRLESALDALRQLLVKRQIFISTEITKMYEKLVITHNRAAAGAAGTEHRGEFTLIVGPKQTSEEPDIDQLDAYVTFGRLTDLAGFKREQAVTMLAALFGAPVRAIEKAIKKGKILVDRSTSSSA